MTLTNCYESGQKKSEGSSNDGKKNGLWTWWDKNGNVELKKNYKNNKLDGLSTSWHKNGQKKSEQNFKNGGEIGPYTKFNAEMFNNGKIEDPVVTQLKTVTDFDGGFSCDDITKFAVKRIKSNVWGELDYGRAIPETLEQLNYYWQSHAPMIKSQWENVFEKIRIDSSDGVEIIDYGCRDGLASLLFLDKFNSDIKECVSKIKLIEPSLLALQRAKNILDWYNSNMQIVEINKKLDDLETKDLETDQNLSKIHLFSNILDIEGFDIFKLFNKIIESKGDHTFLAVSHDRNFKGGTPRLENIYRAFTEQKHDQLKINWDMKETFEWKKGKTAICFIIDLKVIE